MELICQCGAPAELKREHNPNYSMTWIECTKCPMATVQRGWTGTDASIVDALVFHWNNRRTPAAQDAAQGREVVAFRVRRDGDAALIPSWQDGKPDPVLVKEWAAHGYWFEYGYGAATPTTNSGEIGRKSVGEVAAGDDDVYVGTLYITDRYVEFDMESQPTGMDRLRDKLGAGNFDCVVRGLSRREG